MLNSKKNRKHCLRMKTLLLPVGETNHPASVCAIMLLLVSSVVLLVIAPTMMPAGYSWIIHTTSESAAQSLENAWLARLSFLLFGLAVVWMTVVLRKTWARGAGWLHLLFGVFMLATAVFSHKPWESGIPFDTMEDNLHSFTATAMGFAFSFGVFLRLLQRWKQNNKRILLDVTALLSAIIIPILMLFLSDISGLVQRLMFLVAYIWYGTNYWNCATMKLLKSDCIGRELSSVLTSMKYPSLKKSCQKSICVLLGGMSGTTLNKVSDFAPIVVSSEFIR